MATTATPAASQDVLLHVFDVIFEYRTKPSAQLKSAIVALVSKELLVGVLALCEAELGFPHDAELAGQLQCASDGSAPNDGAN